MRGSLRVWLLALMGLLACSLLSGCGTRKVKVHGKLMYGPAPLTASEQEPILLTFCRYNGEGNPDGPPIAAVTNQATGTYEAVVPAGKHRVCVAYFREGMKDQFDGAFAPGQSPILRDIDGDTELDLDLKQLAPQGGRGPAR